jgi:hypothetical protein
MGHAFSPECLCQSSRHCFKNSEFPWRNYERGLYLALGNACGRCLATPRLEQLAPSCSRISVLVYFLICGPVPALVLRRISFMLSFVDCGGAFERCVCAKNKTTDSASHCMEVTRIVYLKKFPARQANNLLGQNQPI